MGKYTNVRANEMYNAVSTAISELSSHSMSNERQTLQNKNVLNSGVCSKVNKAFSSILSSSTYNGNIPKLKRKLTTLRTVAQYIIKYQSVEKNIRELESRLSSASKYNAAYIRSRISALQRTLSNYERNIDNLLSKY